MNLPVSAIYICLDGFHAGLILDYVRRKHNTIGNYCGKKLKLAEKAQWTYLRPPDSSGAAKIFGHSEFRVAMFRGLMFLCKLFIPFS
jgi:hypothetical protein